MYKILNSQILNDSWLGAFSVAGGFDPLHIGHVRHLQKARALGDYLIVMVSNDADMKRKKGYCFMPLPERMEILRALIYVDEVVETVDTDGTQVNTLRKIRPDIFAKGGDRTPDNMPQNEVDVCAEIGCKLVYNVGEQLNSSRKIVSDAKQKSHPAKG